MTRSMVHEVLDGMRAHGLHLAVAESCTGGLLGAALTAVPDASDVFLGGVISYADEVKQKVLGVDAGRLARSGAISAAVVETMAHGVRDLTGSDVAIAVSGIAGPSGGSEAKPVGTVWIAVLGPGTLMDAQKFHFDGDRDDVRHDSVQKALEMTLAMLREAAAEAETA